jgi:glycosyltransferase involved in cell wall biosynthesis
MKNQDGIFTLNEQFSTTKKLFKEKPSLDNKLEDHFESILFLPNNPERKCEGGLRTNAYFKHNLQLEPLVTIITVVFNGEKFIKETIDSILKQTYSNIEYIIIDGGSTDRTIEIIKQHEPYIDYWISEPDKGIYNAMNKGIKLSVGKIIGILNSDDYYNNVDSINKIVEVYKKNQEKYNDLIILTGSVLKIDESKSVQFINKRNAEYLAKKIDWGMPLNHPSTFISKKIYKKIGLFSTKLKICGDYDFIYRIYHSSYKDKFIFIDNVITNMRLDGISNKMNSIIVRSIEHYMVRKPYKNIYVNIYMSLIWMTKKIIQHLLKNYLSNRILKLYYNRYNIHHRDY